MRFPRTSTAWSALTVAGLSLWVGVAAGQTGPADPTSAVRPTEPIDTAALGALDRMAAYLGILDSFQVQAEVTTEEVLLDGQKVLLATSVDVVADRPTRLRALVASDRQQRLFLYDGKDFVMSAPRLKYYAATPAPATIIELLDALEARYGIELPLIDLFRWGSSVSTFTGITDARVIGPSEIEGITCMHYAFRQAGLDWQIWIQKGDYPLPRKIVLTTTTDDARPQHTAEYIWNLAPSFNDASFAFTVPDDYKKITFEEVKPESVATQP